MSDILTLESITVARGDFVLCQNVCLTLKAGQICHLVGENGTGKSTLLMQIVGLLPMVSGKMQLGDTVDRPIHPIFIGHQLGIHEGLSVEQNLRFLLGLYGVDPDSEALQSALHWVGLAGFETITSGRLSAGQSRRVNLARLALLNAHHSPLWILDEPFTALDVGMVAQLQNRLRAFADQGGAVLLTSHQAVQVADFALDLSKFIV